NESSTKVKNIIAAPSNEAVRIQQLLFNQDVDPPIAKYDLPDIGGRISSTPQLAYCLSLLNPELVSNERLDENELCWSQARLGNHDEQYRLQTMATDLVKAFVRDELKKPDVVAEVVSLAAVLDQDDFRKLLQAFVDGIDHSTLLDIHLLDGLAQLIRNAIHECLDADDLVKILEILSKRLKNTHKQSTQHTYRLALTISNVLDSMVDSQVKGLSREQLHEPLSEYLTELQDSPDAFLVYQAAYAYQALQYIPDDETILQTALRRTGKVIQGISGVVTAVKALDIMGFIEGLQSIQNGLTSVGDAFKLTAGAYENAKALAESGQGFLESLKEGLSFTRKSSWYPALRGLDILVQEGRFSVVEEFIRGAPCKHDPAFQWGVCQRLGEVAASNTWDSSTRSCVTIFLGELYKDDATWGRQSNVKQWILNIVGQLADSPNAYTKDHPGPYPMLSTLPPHESPLLDFVQNKSDVETPLRQLKRERLKDRGGDVYISPRAKASARSKEDFDLTSKVHEFLDSDKKVFLILGDSGAGKSTFNRALEISLWDKYDGKDKRIPLFIHLPAIKDQERDMMAERLRKANFTEIQILELKLHREFIVICDGYDESQQTHNLYMSNELNQPGGWRAQMVISCRTEYTGADYKDCFEPVDRNSGGNIDLYEEAIIKPFNASQIQDYIDQYISLRKPSWESKDYQEALKQVPNLQDLVRNPFLLKLALDVLPQVLETNSKFSEAHITRVGLYDKFVTQWIERAKIRLREMELSSRDKDVFQELSDSGFKDNGIAYLKEFVTAIYDNQSGNAVVSYLERRDRKTWKAPLFNKDEGKHLLREAIPLTRDGEYYRFIHKTILEYGLALAVFDPNEHEETIEPKQPISRRGSSSSVLSFENIDSTETTAVDISQSLLDSPLGRRNLVGELSILEFLSERAQQQPLFKEQLLSVIERSKTEVTVRIAAANAITILVRAGFQFIGMDLRGIRVPGADLSFGMFDSAQLQGADLRKAKLRAVWLRDADLSGAQMAGVRFGELPFLQENSEVWWCEYSPDGGKYAVGTDDGKITLYDTSSWSRIRSLIGHSESVNHLEFSATSDRIASASADKTVRIWDVDTGDCIHTMEGHGDEVSIVEYSPNGDHIASGSGDKTVRIWDTKSGSCIHTLDGHTDRINSVTYSPNGDQVASGSDDKTVRVWDAHTGNCIYTLEGHTDVVPEVAYSLKGDQIASGSDDGTVRLWDANTGKCTHTLKGHDDPVSVVVYSPKGDQIASGSEDYTIRLWNTCTGECTHVLKGHGYAVTTVAYSPKGDHIVSGGEDETVRVWDVYTGDCIQTLEGHSEAITRVSYSPNGAGVTSGCEDKTVRLWDINTGDGVRIWKTHDRPIEAIAYSSKANRVASASIDGTIRLWDFDTGNCVHTLRGHSDEVGILVCSPNDDRVASGSDDGTVRVWDIYTGECLATLQGHDDWVTDAVYSPGGDQIASGSGDQTLRLWSPDTGDCVHVLQGHTDEINHIAYSPNGNRIASGSDDKTIRLWDVSTGECILTLEAHSDAIMVVTFSPKGERIASGSCDNTVRLWDADTGDCIRTLEGHSDDVNDILYSPKGDQIISASTDHTLRIWNVDTGECIHTLQGHTDNVSRIVYSPDGSQIATAAWDKGMVWCVNTGRHLATIPDYNGGATGIAWKKTSEGLYLAVGSGDKSIRRWQLIKEGDEYKVRMIWSSSHDVLAVTNASFSDVQGLSESNTKLLSQRGALIE
ncbi:hypothetical protein BGZ80_010914, partial [Entomortierella chlamydospora]